MRRIRNIAGQNVMAQDMSTKKKKGMPGSFGRRAGRHHRVAGTRCCASELSAGEGGAELR
jgi:hypothetical protein